MIYVCAYNRTVDKVEKFLANEAKGTKVIGAKSLEEMVATLKKPRRVMMLVKAGAAVDAFIEKLDHKSESTAGSPDRTISANVLMRLDCSSLMNMQTLTVPLLEAVTSLLMVVTPNTKTLCVAASLWERACLFGSGVSGGEDGARMEPSLMLVVPLKLGLILSPSFRHCCQVSTEPCCDWVGEEGAGHFVKMVHNGIEYGDMQLICEAYHVMRAPSVWTMTNNEVFGQWNKTELDSFLIEITTDILAFKDTDGKHLVDKIKDSAGQKGTGKWTAISALEYGMPVTLIGEAVFSRCLSSLKDERVAASKKLHGPTAPFEGNKEAFVEDIRQALYASKIVSYAQGFMLMREAAKEFNWNLNYGGIALMWRGGCIIRSRFLGNIKEAFDKNPNLVNLLLDDFFLKAIHDCQASWRNVVATAVALGVPTPAFSTALAFYDGYRSETLPANLLQARVNRIDL
ncbi:putative 6-phosphogluconate dehydrogenase, decarboxylating isoform X2 [Apostichopus japonicus]|uniref:6-phosphogluconate dehydrogenase, decarboxylating n=1 Tax=Stichopus japonicus TaxID=307972 RepID=A0A2G8JEV0_STIJA|nr:putative 6-phosphogluconate dehydrogenase, decarboxylating isoform X2 [Apostichopus japonicus]